MNKKIFLTSILSICIACPAFATDDSIEEGDMCTYTELNTYDGTANIEAIWNILPKTCLPGKYYDKTNNDCLDCEIGSWCPGGTFDVEHNNTGDGKTACSTLASGTYPNSLALSDENTDCYRTCANGDVDHATGVSGNVYYNPNNANGTKQCNATACASGWHIKEGINLSNANLSVTTSASMGITPESFYGFRNKEYYDWTSYDTRVWADNLSDGSSIKGISLCSKQLGNNNNAYGATIVDGEITDETGENGADYCYCKVTHYREDSTSVWQDMNSSWVFLTYIPNVNGSCSDSCYGRCADLIQQNSTTRALFLSSFYSFATCEANNIALKWYNDNVEFVPENEAAEQCTYNETITIPSTEPSKTGYTFGGWKFRSATPANNNNNN